MHRLVPALLGLALFVSPVLADEAGSALTAEDRADLAFFAGLGFADVAGKPYVEVATGRGWVDDEDVEHVKTVRGFLISEEKGGPFRVLTDDLFVRAFVPTGDDAPPLERVGYAALDLAAEVSGLLASARASVETGEKDPLGGIREHMVVRFGERLSFRGRVLALAWACHRNELDDEAHELLELARGAGAFWIGEREEGPLRSDLFEEFATAMIWRAVEAFGDTGIERPQLLSTFRGFLVTFAESEHAKTAQEAVELLTRMIAEDEAHAKAARPFAEMTKGEQIADLIFGLRDQNGGQFMQPGSPSIFFSMGRENDENTPAHQLVAMGYDAVPQLIDALTDVRFTRTVGFWRNFTYSHYVVRIGDAALDILSRIAQRGFWRGTYTAASMVKDGEQNETQERARAWWAEHQAKGERQTLIDAVAKADGNSTRAARQLIEKYPDDALTAIVTGLENARDPRTRFYLVQVLATSMPGDAHAPTLLKELRDGPNLDCKLRAATWLLRHGYAAQAVPPMIEAWREMGDRDHSAILGPDWLAGFLVDAGTPEAIEALMVGFAAHSIRTRYEVLDSLKRRFPRNEASPPLTPEAERILEGFLVALLADESDTGVSSSSSLGSVDDIRIADMAAQALVRMWDDRDAFEFYALLHERDRQLHALSNRWRAKRGYDPVPDPEAEPLLRLPKNEAARLLDDWRNASTPEARARAEAALESKGLAVLPAVRAAAAEAEDASLEALARRLAFCVREVEVRPDGTVVGPRGRRHLDALRACLLTSSSLLELLDVLTGEFPDGAHSLVLTVHRVGNDRGAVVRVEVVPVPRGRELRDGGFWEVTPYVKVGRKTLEKYSTSGDEAPSPQDWEALRGVAAEALSAESDVPVRIRVGIRRALTSTWTGPIPLERILEDARRAAGESESEDDED